MKWQQDIVRHAPVLCVHVYCVASPLPPSPSPSFFFLRTPAKLWTRTAVKHFQDSAKIFIQAPSPDKQPVAQHMPGLCTFTLSLLYMHLNILVHLVCVLAKRCSHFSGPGLHTVIQSFYNSSNTWKRTEICRTVYNMHALCGSLFCVFFDSWKTG